ncbi:MAG: CBS domain-containing protein, partial [Proteobacteria bacterium]
EQAIVTIPDFEEPWIDGLIAFHLVGIVATGTTAGPSTAEAVAVAEPTEIVEVQGVWEHREAGYRLSRFAAANKAVIGIGPETTLHEAVTVMMLNDFSQLPVMTGERDVKGVVTWAEIAARSVLGKLGKRASDCMVQPIILDETNSIFEAIQAVVAKDFVLVRDRQRRIAGIVTAADLSLQFRSLSEPFLLLSEIETHVRNMIGQTFTLKELAAARDAGNTHAIHSVADLTFGEYVFLLQKEANWTRLGVKLDRQAFCRQLDRVRSIRNQVMHFDPDGLEVTDLQTLQEFSSFLKRLEGISN